jgi:Domain of unknown function (DUF1918)
MKRGDTLIMRAKTKRLAPSARSGVIEEVLDEGQPRLVVRWGDGRTTVIAPLAGSYRVEPAKRTTRAKKRR